LPFRERKMEWTRNGTEKELNDGKKQRPNRTFEKNGKGFR
jgi:hypothetical protein